MTSPPTALRLDLIRWYLKDRRDLAWRRTRDPYAVWLSEVMLQQTRVEAVLGYWARFLDALPTVEALASASEEQVVALWSGLGYYRRARSLHAAAKRVVDEYGGTLPSGVASLAALPGFGPYTVGAVRSIAFGESAALVDGNVARVLSRLFALELEPGAGASNRVLWAVAESLVPAALSKAARLKDPRSLECRDPQGQMATDSGPGTWNQALMELGATICAPTRAAKKSTRGPLCDTCPVSRHCLAYAAGRTHELPLVKKPVPSIEVALEILVIETEAGFLMRRRPDSGRLASMWEFPTREVDSTFLWPDEFDRATATGSVSELWSLGSPQKNHLHAITCHRIRASVRHFGTNKSSHPPSTNYDYVPRERMESLPLTGLSAKIMAAL
jgi:A/G-specific adenine glycosylase